MHGSVEVNTIESVIQAETSQMVSRYCLRCRHNLRGLCGEGLRCPECGRAFDASNPRSFSKFEFGENWAALAQFTRVFITFSAICAVIAFFMIAFGFDPIWHLWMVVLPMMPAIVLVLAQIILIWIVQASKGWNMLSRRWMIGGLVLIALFISMVMTQWPLRVNFLLHKPWLDRAADLYSPYAPPPTQSRARVSGKQWIGLLRIRQISVLHNGNVGFQLSGDDGGGTFLVREAPGGNNPLWYNCSTRQFADRWHVVYED